MTKYQLLKRVYQSGQSAFHDRQTEENNPYYHTVERMKAWNMGFHDAQDGVEDHEAALRQLLPEADIIQ